MVEMYCKNTGPYHRVTFSQQLAGACKYGITFAGFKLANFPTNVCKWKCILNKTIFTTELYF